MVFDRVCVFVVCVVLCICVFVRVCMLLFSLLWCGSVWINSVVVQLHVFAYYCVCSDVCGVCVCLVCVMCVCVFDVYVVCVCICVWCVCACVCERVFGLARLFLRGVCVTQLCF